MALEQRPQADDHSGTSSDRSSAFRAGLDAHERSLLEAEQQAARTLLLADHDLDRVLPAAARALSTAEGLRRRQLQVLEPALKMACQEGCHWCCHLKVSLTAPEVFVLATYLEEHASADTLHRVRSRASELGSDPRIFSADAKPEARIPCPVLTEAGTCAAYAARPLACRGWNSTDAQACERALDDEQEAISMNQQLARECAAVALGFVSALADAGLQPELLELTSALAIALNDPHALSRWKAGERIFDAALSDGPTPHA